MTLLRCLLRTRASRICTVHPSGLYLELGFGLYFVQAWQLWWVVLMVLVVMFLTFFCCFFYFCFCCLCCRHSCVCPSLASSSSLWSSSSLSLLSSSWFWLLLWVVVIGCSQGPGNFPRSFLVDSLVPVIGMRCNWYLYSTWIAQHGFSASGFTIRYLDP